MIPPSRNDLRWASSAFTFMVSMLVFLLNLHWWSHASSCFKNSRASSNGSCRHRFPRDRADSTSFTTKGVELKRLPGHEYINGFNDVMMATFKSNHDIQVLIGGKAVLDRIYYCCKYVTKQHNEVDSVSAVALAAFRRRQDKEARNRASNVDQDERTTNRQRVTSMSYALTSHREIAGPLAAFYLLRKACCYMSDCCAVLPLSEILKELVGVQSHTCDLVGISNENQDCGHGSVAESAGCDEDFLDHDATHFETANSIFRPASLLDDYRWRPTICEDVGLYEFVIKFFRRKRTASSSENVLFSCEHPLSTTHCIGIRRDGMVPLETGVRMPYVNETSPADLVVKHCKIALILFKPFRNVRDLAGESCDDAAWQNAYSQWEYTRTKFVCEIMDNMDDYFRARDKVLLTRDIYDANSDENSADYDVDDIDDCMALGDSGEGEGYDEIAEMELSGEMFTDGSIPETDTLNPKLYPGSKQQCDVVDVLMQRDLLTLSARSTADKNREIGQSVLFGDGFEIEGNQLSFDELRKWVADPDTDDFFSANCTDTNERPTEVVELLSEALEPENAEWKPNIASSPVGSYASIQVVSRAKELNQRQHIDFTMAGNALLNRFYKQELGKQKGQGGYISTDFESRLRNDQLLMFLGGAGGTGKGRVIEAITALCTSWHRRNSLVKTALTGNAATLISGRTLSRFLLQLEYAIKRKDFTELDMLIIDEVSMMTKAHWVRLGKLLRLYKKISGVPFGGVHVLFVGDFLQMPPVGSDPIYIDHRTKKKASVIDTEGFELWRRFTRIIMLEQSMRFQNDREWGEGCRKAHVGIWTPEFMRLINSRLVGESVSVANDGGETVFVTPENATRLAPFLDLIAGMPIQVAQNVATTKGVANGCLGTLEDIHFPYGTVFHVVRDSQSGVVVQFLADHVIMRYFVFRELTLQVPYEQGFRQNCFL